MVIKVVVLGSGGTIPNLSRNLPAMAIQCDGDLFLFDCGEGTQIQLLKAQLSFGKIEGIFISHLHGDHVMGLPGLLMTMGQVPREQPLLIAGPPGLQDFVEGNRRSLGFQFQFPVQIYETTGGSLYSNEKLDIEAAPSDHSCFNLAFALRERERVGRFSVEAAKELGVPEGPMYGRLQKGETVTLADGTQVHPEQVLGPARPGRKIVYAPDTRPCREVGRLAHQADVLIHDGMFDDDLEDQAVQKRHSTIVQAARLARRAGVKQLVLTHLSSRYFSDGPLLEKARRVFHSTCMARDLMEIVVPMYK
jgi:ribonuclease Z